MFESRAGNFLYQGRKNKKKYQVVKQREHEYTFKVEFLYSKKFNKKLIYL